MLHHSIFTTSKYHRKENKYGSLTAHKRWATKRMNNPAKLKAIDRGLEKIYRLCDRCIDINTPTQFITPGFELISKKRMQRIKYHNRHFPDYSNYKNRTKRY